MGVLNFKGVKLEDAPKDAVPVCPHCKETLSTLWIKTKGTGIVEQQQIIMCPHCRCFLGYGTLSL